MTGEDAARLSDPSGDAWTTLIEIRIHSEMLKEANRLIGENGWEVDEGLRIIFANGLFYLLGRRRLEGLDGGQADLAEEVKRLTAELMDMQSKYAVMKFRAFTLQQDNQTLEFQNTGLRGENRMAMSRLTKFREDEQALTAELSRLRAENERLRQRLGLVEGDATLPRPRPSLVRRLLPWLRH